MDDKTGFEQRRCALALSLHAVGAEDLQLGNQVKITYARSNALNRSWIVGPKDRTLYTEATHRQCMKEEVLAEEIECAQDQCSDVKMGITITKEETINLVKIKIVKRERLVKCDKTETEKGLANMTIYFINGRNSQLDKLTKGLYYML